jgi:hypothetical protein
MVKSLLIFLTGIISAKFADGGVCMKLSVHYYYFHVRWLIVRLEHLGQLFLKLGKTDNACQGLKWPMGVRLNRVYPAKTLAYDILVQVEVIGRPIEPFTV